MKITKFGHCCLLIEENDLRILTDPGAYTIEEQEKINHIDVILITHEHQDHFHIDSLKVILKNNSNAKIITNNSVGKLLDKENIKHELLIHHNHTTIKEVLIEAFGEKHEEIYKEYGMVENTGYFINNKFFYPGDAYTVPGKIVEILALPVAGPWLKIKDATEYLKKIKPKYAFPVHDGGIIPGRYGSSHSIPQKTIKEWNGNFVIEKEMEF